MVGVVEDGHDASTDKHPHSGRTEGELAVMGTSDSENSETGVTPASLGPTREGTGPKTSSYPEVPVWGSGPEEAKSDVMPNVVDPHWWPGHAGDEFVAHYLFLGS